MHSMLAADDTLLTPVAARAALRDVSALFYSFGWAFGTSGNYSVVLQREPLRLLITASGRDKRAIGEADFVEVDGNGRPASSDSAARPSAETLLHAMLARRGGVGAVLHTHSVWATRLSETHATRGGLRLAGFEMLKGLDGIATHEAAVELPIFENSQNITALADEVSARLARQPAGPPHAFLLRAHGMYAWGRDLAEARRHVEILEFLLEVVGRGG